MDFPGSTVVKNLLANAGNTGSIPDPGRPHSQGTATSVRQATEPVL